MMLVKFCLIRIAMVRLLVMLCTIMSGDVGLDVVTLQLVRLNKCRLCVTANVI